MWMIDWVVAIHADQKISQLWSGTFWKPKDKKLIFFHNKVIDKSSIFFKDKNNKTWRAEASRALNFHVLFQAKIMQVRERNYYD